MEQVSAMSVTSQDVGTLRTLLHPSTCPQSTTPAGNPENAARYLRSVGSLRWNEGWPPRRAKGTGRTVSCPYGGV